MAAPAPPQPAFTALFDDISKDPFDGTYGPLFALFDISLTDANPTPNNVCQQIAAASNQRLPLAIALLMRSFAPYLLQTHLHNKSPSLLRSYWKGMALGGVLFSWLNQFSR
jgi:hypothetical protein